MGFDNEHPGRKDRRRPYYKSARFDRTCRPHGSCPWCERNRAYQRRRADEDMRQQLEMVARG